MRVLCCGGRECIDRELLTATRTGLHQERRFSLLIAGGARGADTMAEEWAKTAGLPCTVYQADWKGPWPKGRPFQESAPAR